jgi:3-oxoacyl-[acyl-carrier protein] reductase
MRTAEPWTPLGVGSRAEGVCKDAGMPSGGKPLEGRAALITGASRRVAIGAGIARRLVADGAAVMLHSWSPHDDRQPWGGDPGGIAALVDELRLLGGQVEQIEADFADAETPTLVVDAARRAFGHLDVLVANHARTGIQSLEALTAAEIDLTFAVNTRATLLLVQAFAASHDGRPGGRVILFTSGQYYSAMPGELPYIASKAALRELTPSLAVHLMPRGITVNCVNPGPNDTGYAEAATLALVAARNPGGRWGRPADAARLVAWLASDEADWITGQTIASDGGWSSR